MALEFVLVLVMALLSFLRIDTSSLQAQGGQRRPSFFNILRDIPLGRYITFQMAEVAIPRHVFAAILRLIDDLRPSAMPP